MITEELLQYVKQAKAQGVTDIDLISELIHNGWTQEDIEEALGSIYPSTKKVTFFPFPNKIFLLSFAIVALAITTAGIYFLPKSFVNKLSLSSFSENSIQGQLPIVQDDTSPVRVNIDEENDGFNTGITFGFLKSSLVGEKESNDKEDPFLFYDGSTVVNHIWIDRIKGYDIKTKKEYVVLDVTNFPDIVKNPYGSVLEIRYLNKSKTLVFVLGFIEDQNVQNQGYVKTSIYLYNVSSKQLKEAVSTSEVRADRELYKNLRVSPDENYLFWLIQSKALSVHFSFYNIQDGTLKTYPLKTDILINGFALGWSPDSKTVEIGYSESMPPDPHLSLSEVLHRVSPEVLRFITVSPDGKTQTVLEKENSPIKWPSKLQYFQGLRKIFYIANPSNTDTGGTIFGFYDIAKNTFNTVAPANDSSRIFVYDYKGGIIYDTFQWITNGSSMDIKTTNRALNYYDLITQKSKQIINKNPYVVGFDGDYNHLLVNEKTKDKSLTLFSDITIRSGEVRQINIASVGFDAPFSE